MSHQNLDLYSQYLINRFVPVSLFVDSNLNILYTHGNIEEFFSFPRALVQFNVSRMLEGEALLQIKNGVEGCINGKGPVAYSDVKFEKAGGVKTADLRFQKAKLPEINQQIVLVEIIPKDMFAEAQADNDRSLDQSSDWNRQVKSLEMQLKEAHQRAQNLIDEQEATNEELQTSNRELMASNEELQSTNEELQSVNEELYTVNSELQLKNEALSTANNDILNLLRSTDIGTIFLDKELKVRRFTPAIQKHFNLLDMDIGRPISDFSTTLIGIDISQISRQVYVSLDKYEQEVEDTNGNHYLLRVLPYRTRDDVIQGLVITFVDVNELIKIRERMLAFAKKFKAIFQNADDIILELDANKKIEEVSREIGPYTQKNLVGKNFFDLLPDTVSRHLETKLEDLSEKLHPVSFEFKLENRNGDNLYYQGTLIPLGDSPKNGAAPEWISSIIVLQDITKSVKKQNELAQNLEEYQAFMDNARHQIALIDREGKIKYVNYTQHTGIGKKAMIGTSVYDYLNGSEQKKVRSSIENIFSGNPFENINFTFRYEDGKKANIELVATPVIIEERIKYIALIGYEDRSL